MVPCIAKHLSDDSGRLSDVLVHNGTRYNLEEIRIDIGGNGSSEEGLASAWGPIEQDPLWVEG